MTFIFILWFILIHTYAFSQTKYWEKRFHSANHLAIKLLGEKLNPLNIKKHNPKINQFDDILLARKLTNTGRNTITIEVDPNFRQYLIGHRKPYQGRNTIKPGEHLFVPHMYVIITTSDGKPANLFQEFIEN